MTTPVEGSGSEGTPVEGGQIQSDNSNPNDTPGSVNPNWESVLNLLPEQFHGVVTPHFAEWDKAANARIESLNTQYEPYKVFADHGISGDDLRSGINLVNAINEQPQVILEALAQQLGFTLNKQETTPSGTEPTGEEETYNLPPGYERLQQGVELMAQRMLDAEKAQKEAAEQAELNTQLEAVEKKYGKFNESLFLPYLTNALNDPNMTVDKAAANFAEIMGHNASQVIAQQPYAPNLLGGSSGGGAGLPSQNIDPRKLDNKQTKDLVVAYLEAAAKQSS